MVGTRDVLESVVGPGIISEDVTWLVMSIQASNMGPVMVGRYKSCLSNRLAFWRRRLMIII